MFRKIKYSKTTTGSMSKESSQPVLLDNTFLAGTTDNATFEKLAEAEVNVVLGIIHQIYMQYFKS
jgi:hypothetical protein